MKKFLILLSLFCLLSSVSTMAVSADTLPLNPSSTPQSLEDYNSYYTRLTTGWGCTGYGSTYNNALFFDSSCAVYELGSFRSSVTFHVVNSFDFNSQAYLSTWWGNEAGSIKAFGTLVTGSASTSAVFTPELSWDGGASGLQSIQGTNTTLAYPFDLTFIYNTTSVSILANGQTLLNYPVDVSVNERTVIIGQSLQVGGISANISTSDDQYITCAPLDVGCNIYNMRLWLGQVFSVNIEDISTTFEATRDLMESKAPIAYVVHAFNLDFSNTATDSAVPILTFSTPEIHAQGVASYIPAQVVSYNDTTMTGGLLKEFFDSIRPFMNGVLYLMFGIYFIFVLPRRLFEKGGT